MDYNPLDYYKHELDKIRKKFNNETRLSIKEISRKIDCNRNKTSRLLDILIINGELTCKIFGNSKVYFSIKKENQ